MSNKQDQARQGTVVRLCGPRLDGRTGLTSALFQPSGYADHNADPTARTTITALTGHSDPFPVSGDPYDFLSDLHIEVQQHSVSLFSHIYIWPTVHVHSLPPPEHLTRLTSAD